MWNESQLFSCYYRDIIAYIDNELHVASELSLVIPGFLVNQAPDSLFFGDISVGPGMGQHIFKLRPGRFRMAVQKAAAAQGRTTLLGKILHRSFIHLNNCSLPVTYGNNGC